MCRDWSKWYGFFAALTWRSSTLRCAMPTVIHFVGSLAPAVLRRRWAWCRSWYHFWSIVFILSVGDWNLYNYSRYEYGASLPWNVDAHWNCNWFYIWASKICLWWQFALLLWLLSYRTFSYFTVRFNVTVHFNVKNRVAPNLTFSNSAEAEFGWNLFSGHRTIRQW